MTCIGLIISGCDSSNVSAEVPIPEIDKNEVPYFSKKESLVEFYTTSPSLKQKHDLNGFTYTVTQLSPDLLALAEIKNKTFTQELFDSTKKNYSDLYYFKLNISREGFNQELLKYDLKSGQEYTERIKYCSFKINQDLYLVQNTDTVYCALHEFERSFNLASGLNFLVAFSKNKPFQNFTLVLQDNLFKQGAIKFFFNRSIDYLPYLRAGENE